MVCCTQQLEGDEIKYPKEDPVIPPPAHPALFPEDAVKMVEKHSVLPADLPEVLFVSVRFSQQVALLKIFVSVAA